LLEKLLKNVSSIYGKNFDFCKNYKKVGYYPIS
jgi:hypothetical protein